MAQFVHNGCKVEKVFDGAPDDLSCQVGIAALSRSQERRAGGILQARRSEQGVAGLSGLNPQPKRWQAFSGGHLDASAVRSGNEPSRQILYGGKRPGVTDLWQSFEKGHEKVGRSLGVFFGATMIG